MVSRRQKKREINQRYLAKGLREYWRKQKATGNKQEVKAVAATKRKETLAKDQAIARERAATARAEAAEAEVRRLKQREYRRNCLESRRSSEGDTTPSKAEAAKSFVVDAIVAEKRKGPMQTFVREVVELAPEAERFAVCKALGATRKVMSPKKPRKEPILADALAAFFEDDENSRATAGVKETVRRGNAKKQKRILLHGMGFLLAKFKIQHPQFNIHLSTFYRHRPDHVVTATLADREQCLCPKCENLDLLVDGMYKARLLSSKEKHEILLEFICSEDSVACLSRQCSDCKDKSPIVGDVAADLPEVMYHRWEPKVGTSGYHTVSRKVSCEVAIQQLLTQLCEYAAHFMRFRHQYQAIHRLKSNVQAGHLILHIDFSQAYDSKYNRLTSNGYYAHSTSQITIHQGVAYLKGFDPQSFATLCDDNNKKSDAIAAHLDPVLDHFQLLLGESLELVSLISDSPSSQYRNRKTLYIVDRVLRRRNIVRWQWIYTEAGHGKSAADGVGATIKRRCNQLVSSGEMRRVSTAAEAMQAMEVPQKLSITVFTVTSADIARYSRVLDVLDDGKKEQLRPMLGIANAHHVCRLSVGVIYRELACLCEGAAAICGCHKAKLWDMLLKPTPQSAPSPAVGMTGRLQVSGITASAGSSRGRGRGRQASNSAGLQRNPVMSISFQ
jgi:hypothetical protein